MTSLKLFAIWYVSSSAFATSDCPRGNLNFDSYAKLRHYITVVGPDDRKERRPGDVAPDIEKAQARVYCLRKPYSGNGLPSKEKLKKQKHLVANAVFAFQDNMAIISRHMFMDEKGRALTKPENCYIEHIASGEILPVVDAQYKPHPKDGNLVSDSNQDYAVVKLRNAPTKNSGYLHSSDIIVDSLKDPSQRVKVVSNYADNNSAGRTTETLTMTTCQRFGLYNLPSGALSNVWGTDCDTGKGSSGAQAYIDVNGSPKLFGINAGSFIDESLPPNSPWDAEKNSTKITAFDSSIFESFETLKRRTDL